MIREVYCPVSNTRLLYEYRRADRPIPLECRELRPDGHPHDDHWYPVGAEEWLIVRDHAPEIITTLIPEFAGSTTLTPRG
jgi:hypothetical protein